MMKCSGQTSNYHRILTNNFANLTWRVFAHTEEQKCRLKPTFSMCACLPRTRTTAACTNCSNSTPPPVMKVTSLKFHTDKIAPWHSWGVSPKQASHPINELNSHKFSFTLSSSIIHVIGTIYLIGGNVNGRLPNVGSRVVSMLHLRSGSFKSAQSLREAVVHPAVATSYNAIAICGGLCNGSPTSSCQVYSAGTDK